MRIIIDNGEDEDLDGITDCEEDNGYLVMWPADVNGTLQTTS